MTSTGATVVNGDLGLTPGTSITGFAAVPPGGLGIVNGEINLDNSAASQAATDLSSAYSAAAALTPTVPGTMTLNDIILTPGVYNSSSTLMVSGTITLDGEGETNPTFVFQVGSALTFAVGTQIVLIDGASASDVFWQVGTAATLDASTVFAGSLLASTTIDVGLDSTVDGGLLAMTGAVTLNDDLITAVPEPADIGLIVAGCAGLFVALRTSRRRNSEVRRGEAAGPRFYWRPDANALT